MRCHYCGGEEAVKLTHTKHGYTSSDPDWHAHGKHFGYHLRCKVNTLGAVLTDEIQTDEKIS